MSYRPVEPPFTQRLVEMPRNELRRYFEWFLGEIPQRVDELTSAVRGDPDFGSWTPDCTRSSLEVLSKWYVGQVSTRALSEKERRAKVPDERLLVAVPDSELTGHTLSVAMDIGMYLSQVFLRQFPALRWLQRLGSKRHVDFGQPVLAGFGRVNLNPVRVSLTYAYRIASGNPAPNDLREAYDYWAHNVEP
jgi:hypothetical protein